MFARVFGLAVLVFVLAAFSVGTAGDKDKDVKKEVGKDVVKEKKDKKEKKEPPKVELKSVAGEVIVIDFAKGSFALGTADNKSHSFVVNDDTKFVGPKGGSRGMGKPGLKDETMFKGAAVRVVMSPDEKVALEVHLPARGTKPVQATPEPIKPPLNVPSRATPPQTAPPQIEIPYDSGTMRVGPVRRLLRRLFGRE